MAKLELHGKALELRKLGMSYSVIKEDFGVSKSTLSKWLTDHPLSRERINELRGNSERRIERCRETKKLKRAERITNVYKTASRDIGILTEREIFIAGLFLYWGEGSKNENATISLANTDPSVLVFFIRWLQVLKVPTERVRVRLQIYADMNSQKEISYWTKTLQLPATSFRKPYVKSSNRVDITYKQRFAHGTCNIIYGNRDISEYVHSALELMRVTYIAPDT